DLAHELRTRYIEGTNWFDGVLKESVTHLRELGLLENTLLVVTSDHGEAFGEHGILGHGRQLYDELIRIPLVMVGPAPFRGGAEIPGTVGLIDVFPTFLDYAGMAPLPASRGTSFLPRLRGEIDHRPVVSEEKLYASKMGYPIEGVRLSVRSPRWKFVITYDVLQGTVREEAFDLLADPEEQDDLADENGDLSPHIPFGACFCEEVQAVRNRVWELVERNNLLYGTVYGAGVGNVETLQPHGCDAR
ncbi:MAG: sulfatase family protein, partial [Planctomycetota bacterium]